MNTLTRKTKPISILLKPTSKNIYISLFSTSTRRDEEESRNVRVSVWWDIENCGVPNGVNVFKISHSITSALRTNGIKGPIQITAFGDIFCLNRPNQEALSSTGVNLVHIPNGGKNSADRSLLVDIMYWVSQNPPPAHVFLISGDRDFAGILHKLRMNNYNILLAAREANQTPSVLYSAASIMWQWSELAKGENLSGKHFNQPPDGPYNSWYGHYRGPLEDPFGMYQPQKNAEVDNSSNVVQSPENKYRSVPVAVLRQLRRVVNSHPQGLTITKMREQLLKSKVMVDKDLYGYKTFSRFLQALPRIIKMESCPDGQFFLKPASSEIAKNVEEHDNSASAMTVNGKKDTKLSAKANCETLVITRMVDIDPPISPFIEENEKIVQKKPAEETTEKKALDASSGNTHLSIVANVNLTEKSEARLGFVGKIINWFKFWRNVSSSVKPLKLLHNDPSPIEEDTKKSDDPLHSMKLDDDVSAPHTRKHELFTKDSFWNSLCLFFKTHHGSNIVLNSMTRSQLAKRLQNEGPLFLQPLHAIDFRDLVDLLVSDKKWLKEFPATKPRFKIVHPIGLSSSNSSSDENSPIKVTSTEKPRSKILADCQKLLDEILSCNPDGFNMGIFKDEFRIKYGYALDHQKFGFPKLIDLLKLMHGATVVYSRVLPDNVVDATGMLSSGTKEKSTCSNTDMSDSAWKDDDDYSSWEELGPLVESNASIDEAKTSDNKVSDLEKEDLSSSPEVKVVAEEDSSLLKVLDSWYTKNGINSRDYVSDPETRFSSSEDEATPAGNN